MIGNRRNNSCCCGCSPHEFVFISSLFYILGSFILLIATIISGFAPVALLPLFVLALSILVLWGNRFSISCFYLPALLLSVICAFLFVCSSTCVIMYGVYILYIHYEDQSVARNKNEVIATIGMGLGTIFAGLALLVASALFSYFVEVFYRAYLFLKERNSIRDHFPITMNEISKFM